MANELNLSIEWRSRRFADAATGLRAFAEHMNKNFGDVPGAISVELRGFLEDVSEALSDRHSKPWPGGTGPKTLSKRSGFMLEAIRESITVDGATIPSIEGRIAIPGKRKIHENGGVLRPKKSKYLTIPLPAALDSRGIPLKPKARDWKNTFVIRSKAGNLLIVRRKGAGIEPLYLLKTEVYIPPRLGMRETIEAGSTMLADRLSDAILKQLRK